MCTRRLHKSLIHNIIKLNELNDWIQIFSKSKKKKKPKKANIFTHYNTDTWQYKLIYFRPSCWSFLTQFQTINNELFISYYVQ